MKTLFLIIILFCCSVVANCQNIYLTNNPIYIDIIQQYIYVYNKQDSTISTNRGEQKKEIIKVFDLTTKGRMKFVYYDTTRNVLLVGQYKEAKKLSKPFNFKKDGARTIVWNGGIGQHFYSALRDSVWCYYSNGSLIRKDLYK